MPISQAELANRLKSARDNVGLTQQQVADELGISRTAIALIESGDRKVNSLELDRLAGFYGRIVQDFVQEKALEQDVITAMFRAPGMEEDHVLERELRRCAVLCSEMTRLEKLLGLEGPRNMVVAYPFAAPAGKWDAIQQGKELAEQERNRLGLGSSPVWEIAEIIKQQGVRVTEMKMHDSISGIFFHGAEPGLVIVVNRNHHRNRRLFSYAHEYCHLLVDRSRVGNVSRDENQHELMEIRANVFAAHFLLPESGIRSFLKAIGKSDPSRSQQDVYGGKEIIQVQRRGSSGYQDIQVHDVVRLAHHYGTSYEAALYHLMNVKVLDRDRFENLKAQSDLASRVATVFGLAQWDEKAHWRLSDQAMDLALEAYRREEISRHKVLDLASQLKLDVKSVEGILDGA